METLKKILVIQTAFIGDAILASGIVDKLHRFYPEAQLDLLVRKGNDGLYKEHPYLHRLLVWDKKNGKNKNLLKLASAIRKERYDLVVNLQRFASSGFLTAFSNAKIKVGFDKNPFAFAFTYKVSHQIGTGKHEIERNNELIARFTDTSVPKPKLYPARADFAKVAIYKGKPYVCMAPNSVWFTKQYPEHKWIELLKAFPEAYSVYLLGGPPDKEACERIKAAAGNKNVVNLAGQLSFLESAALMQEAKMNYVNDSGPLHIASSVNAPTMAIFCSTIPAFGFGPLADLSVIIETHEQLSCRPCGLHGHKACPERHFKCAESIEVNRLIEESHL